MKCFLILGFPIRNAEAIFEVIDRLFYIYKVNLICEANFPPWNSYALKWIGSTILPTSEAIFEVIDRLFYIYTDLVGIFPFLWAAFYTWIGTKVLFRIETLHADLLLAGITQLVTVLVADKIHQHQYIRSLNPAMQDS